MELELQSRGSVLVESACATRGPLVTDPAKYTAKSADCASCHMAKIAVARHPADPLDFTSYTYRTDHSDDLAGPFRQFGYDRNLPILSARVVNETVVTLDYLNKVVLQ